MVNICMLPLILTISVLQEFMNLKNGGRSWARLTTGDMTSPDQYGGADWWHLAVDPADFKIIYAGGLSRIFKSIDGGQTWVKIRNDGCHWIYVHPADGTVFCGQGNMGETIQISHDQGMSWSQTAIENYEEGSLRETLAFAAVPGTKTIYTGTDQVLRSDNGGLSWHSLGALGLERTRILVDPMDDKILFLTAMTPSLSDYRSTDSGRTWSTTSEGFLTGNGGLMTFDPVHKIIYHQSKTGSGTVLIRSYDNGSSWQQFGQSNPFSDPFQLLPDPNDASKLWLTGECDTGPAVSRDGGATFSTLANFSRNLCLPIMLEDNRGQNIYIVNLGSFIAFSDGGNNWTEIR